MNSNYSFIKYLLVVLIKLQSFLLFSQDSTHYEIEKTDFFSIFSQGFEDYNSKKPNFVIGQTNCIMHSGRNTLLSFSPINCGFRFKNFHFTAGPGMQFFFTKYNLSGKTVTDVNGGFMLLYRLDYMINFYRNNKLYFSSCNEIGLRYNPNNEQMEKAEVYQVGVGLLFNFNRKNEATFWDVSVNYSLNNDGSYSTFSMPTIRFGFRLNLFPRSGKKLEKLN